MLVLRFHTASTVLYQVRMRGEYVPWLPPELRICVATFSDIRSTVLRIPSSSTGSTPLRHAFDRLPRCTWRIRCFPLHHIPYRAVHWHCILLHCSPASRHSRISRHLRHNADISFHSTTTVARRLREPSISTFRKWHKTTASSLRNQRKIALS